MCYAKRDTFSKPDFLDLFFIMWKCNIQKFQGIKVKQVYILKWCKVIILLFDNFHNTESTCKIKGFFCMSTFRACTHYTHSNGNIWDNYVITDEDTKDETYRGFQSSTEAAQQLKFVAKSTSFNVCMLHMKLSPGAY